MDEDEDTIVEEIPVFLSKSLSDNLYLFQYPTKTKISNFSSTPVANCCIKPFSKDVKVDFVVNTETTFYDRFKGKQFAIAADGKTQPKGERPTFSNGTMDKLSFISTNAIKDSSKYVVAAFHDKEIHISPLTSILQFRPSFKHFDKEDKRMKAQEKADEDNEDDEELQQITVKFAKTGATRTKKVKDQTYESFVKQRTDEPWCESFWHLRSSPTAELERQKVFAIGREDTHSMQLSRREYTNKLLIQNNQEKSIDTVLPSKVLSRAKLNTMPLGEQLKYVLRDSKMCTFDNIMSFLTENEDEPCTGKSLNGTVAERITPSVVLRTLPQVGILIDGNWVVKSEVLYPPDTFSKANGVPAELMVRARDYVLYKLSQHEFIDRRHVAQLTHLPPQETLEVLQSVARINIEKKWQTLLPADSSFIAKHSDLVQRQEMLWKATEHVFNGIDPEISPKRVRKRSIREIKVEKMS